MRRSSVGVIMQSEDMASLRGTQAKGYIFMSAGEENKQIALSIFEALNTRDLRCDPGI